MCVCLLIAHVSPATPPSLRAHFGCRQDLSLFIQSPPALPLFNVTEGGSRQSRSAGSTDPSAEPLNRTCFGPLSRRFLPGGPAGFMIAAGATRETWPTPWSTQVRAVKLGFCSTNMEPKYLYQSIVWQQLNPFGHVGHFVKASVRISRKENM